MQLNYYPEEANTDVDQLFDKLLEPYWDDWFRGDIDRHAAMTVFLSPTLVNQRSARVRVKQIT